MPTSPRVGAGGRKWSHTGHLVTEDSASSAAARAVNLALALSFTVERRRRGLKLLGGQGLVSAVELEREKGCTLLLLFSAQLFGEACVWSVAT